MRLRRGNRVQERQRFARVETERRRPIVVRPAVIMNFEEAVTEREQAAGAVFEANVLLDVKRFQRRFRQNRRDIVETVNARYFFDDILFDRNILRAAERRDADAERSVREVVRLEFDGAEDFERFFLREIDADKFVQATRRKFDPARLVLEVARERETSFDAVSDARLFDELQNALRPNFNVCGRLRFFVTLRRVGAEV